MTKLFNWGAYCLCGYFIILFCDLFPNFLVIKEFVVMIVCTHALEIPAPFSQIYSFFRSERALNSACYGGWQLHKYDKSRKD